MQHQVCSLLHTNKELDKEKTIQERETGRLTESIIKKEKLNDLEIFFLEKRRFRIVGRGDIKAEGELELYLYIEVHIHDINILS